MTLDPAIAWALRASLAGVFLAAARHKWSDRKRFESTVRSYALLDRRAVPTVAKLLPWVEAAVATCFLHVTTQRFAVLFGAALLSVYTFAIAINLARGRRDIDCGCFTSATEVPLSATLLLRNLALIGTCAALWLPRSTRVLSWLDGATVVMALLTVCFLWSAAQRLAHTGAALRKLGGAR